MTGRLPPTLEQQADMLGDMIRRCTLLDGTAAAESYLRFDPADVEELRLVEARLRRIAPFEDRIRKMVTGR